MINETDKLFINSTKAVNPTPKQDKLLGEVPIKEYIDFDSLEWSNFLYVESMTACEAYVNLANSTETIIMNDYHIIAEANSIDKVVEMFVTRLLLKNIAATTKRLASGQGELIFQSRTMVQLFERPNGDIRLKWRGKLDIIHNEQKARPKRTPMCSPLCNPFDRVFPR